MMKKRILIVFIILFLLLFGYAQAEFNPSSAFNWLLSRSSDGSYNNNIIDTSLAVLALNQVGASVDNEIAYLHSVEDNKHCWPQGSCRVKDTAMAVLALNDAGDDVSENTQWLLDSQSVGLTAGKWALQVDTDSSGACEISYLRGNDRVPTVKSVRVDSGRFPECGGSTFFDINTCLERNILNRNPSMEMDVDCSSLSNVVMALSYINGLTYYIIDSTASNVGQFTVKNSCFGMSPGGSCSYESTLYANWALKEVSNIAPSLLYLTINYNNRDIVHNSILNLISERARYVNELVSRQRRDGSFESDVFKTAIALLSLSGNTGPFTSGSNWLISRQRSDGSWGTVADTAITLYSSFSSGAVTLAECFENQPRNCQKQEGICAGSREFCTNGQFSGCNTEVYSQHNPEYQETESRCDNLNNDCDGSIDEGCECRIGETRNCVKQSGVCSGSRVTCSTGAWPACDDAFLQSYNPAYQSNENLCDGLDNDCDGALDEGCECSPGETQNCPKQAGACSGAVQICAGNGSWPGCGDSIYLAHNASYQQNENVCDNIDNNCDGAKDEGCACSTGSVGDCSVQLGACSGLSQTCVNGTWASCNFQSAAAYQSKESSCKDNIDNDCDGSTDFADIDCGTCQDDIKNLDERGIDCGGVCSQFDDCCSNSIKDDGEENVDCGGVCGSCRGIFICGNDKCETELGETPDNCPRDCESEKVSVAELCSNGVQDRENREEGIDCGGLCDRSCETEARQLCVNNGICDIDKGETRANCDADCFCGDGLCDRNEKILNDCSEDCGEAEKKIEPSCNSDKACDDNEDCECKDCFKEPRCLPVEEKGKGGIIFVIVIIVLIIGIIGFYYYKYSKKKKSKPSPFFSGAPGSEPEESPLRPPARSSFSSAAPKRAASSNIEKELDKSILEAKKLLGKK